jgi:glutaconate CoA-transferase subunit A
MAFAAELIRQGRRDLHLMGWNNAIDFDLLIGAGCARSVETSYVGMGALGLARNYRRWAEDGRVRVNEHTETTAIDMFRARAMGIPFIPTRTPLGTDLPKHNDRIVLFASPIDGSPLAAVPAVEPDVSVIHAHRADERGNIQLDAASWMDNSVDILIAKSGRAVIVTVEQIVSTAEIERQPLQTILPSVFVTAVVEAPYGAHPCCCDSRYGYDIPFFRDYYAASYEQASFDAFVDRYYRSVPDHWTYLDRLGMDRMVSL